MLWADRAPERSVQKTTACASNLREYLRFDIIFLDNFGTFMRSLLVPSVLAIAIGFAIFAGRIPRPAQQTPAKRLKLAFVTNNPSDFWTVAHRGVEKAEKELGVEVDYQIPANGTAAEQAQIVNDLLSKGTQGIAISPVDPANQTDLLSLVAQKTLLFTQDSDAPQSKRACYVGVDSVAAGRQAGEELKRVLPHGGQVMIFVGRKDAQNAADRINGMKDAIKGTNILLLDVRTDAADRTRAKANVSDALTRYPKLAACVGIWSYNGPAILSALGDAHKTGKVKIVCFDEERATLDGVKRGEISATIVQQPFQLGYLSVINMAKYLSGDKKVVPASRQVFVPTLAIRRNNVDAFSKNLARLRRMSG